jgi:MFS family permease
LLRALGTSEWEKLLALCDAAQLTLLLRQLCRPHLPDWVLARVDRDYLKNALRFERLRTAAFEISDVLKDRSIDFVLLKGFAHSPDFTSDPLVRAQGDIDLWCLPETVTHARDTLVELGYRPVGKSTCRHLDPMIRETDWEWRGDYFAIDLPIPVDLHYRLWDSEMEGFPGPAEHGLWSRRCFAAVDSHSVPVLGLPDALAFAAMHFMLHLLHGDVRLHRGWEIAYFLQHNADNDTFWLHWQTLHAVEARTPQVIAFALAHQWFRCRLPQLIKDEIAALSEDLLLWIQHYSLSPVEALFVPNKDELWLHLCLLNSFKDKVRLIYRRLLPLRSARLYSTAGNSPESSGGKQPNLRNTLLAQRVRHHARTLPVTCVRGLEWWWRRQRLGREFLVFQLASVLFDFGEFVFFLLYNLYLLDLGYTEKFLGQVAAAVTAGTFVGLVPAAMFARRFGLRNAVAIAIVGTATATTLRAVVAWQPALIASAFLNGLFMSFWAVSLPPAIAGLTSARNRTLGFSLVTSLGIGVGALAGLIGGRLPALLVHLSPSLTTVGSKRIALLAGSGFAAFAVIPAMLLKFPSTPQTETDKKVYPRSRFTNLFFTALFVWTLGTGGFNPFFNAYFSRHLHFSVERIGLIFSYAQFAQVIAILAAPAVLKRISDVKGIASMQAATAAMLACLAAVSNPLGGALFYVAYMCFQYMSAPCLLSMLMSRVSRAEQSGASALNFMVTSLAGICAATLAGLALPHTGYEPVLAVCAGVTLSAAAIFYCFVRR